MSRAEAPGTLIDLSRLGSDERHRALAPAFSTGATAQAARPAATAAALSAVPVGKAGVGFGRRQRGLVRSVGRPDRATVRPNDAPAYSGQAPWKR